MIRLAFVAGAAMAFMLGGCTANPGASGYSYLTGGQNSSSSSSTGGATTSSSGGGGWVSPFSPGGSGNDVITLQNPGNNGGSIIAWTAQRCATLGDSLAKYISGSEAYTNMGRFDWAEPRTSSLTINGQPYSYYYGIAKAIRDNGGFNTTPLYPTFDTLDANGNAVVFSATNPAEPSDPANTAPGLWGAHKLVAFCIASCYRGNVPLFFNSQAGVPVSDISKDALAYPIAQAKSLAEAGNLSFASVVTLSPASVLGALSLITSAIDHFTQDLKVANAATQGFYKIATADGHSITVTHNHGLLTHGGVLRTADQIVGSFRSGHPESLLTAFNSEESISSVTDLELQEQSYNVMTAPPVSSSDDLYGDLRQHVVVSGNGYFLSSDSLMQNNIETMADQLNRELDRGNMIDPLNP